LIFYVNVFVVKHSDFFAVIETSWKSKNASFTFFEIKLKKDFKTRICSFDWEQGEFRNLKRGDDKSLIKVDMDEFMRNLN
jgi:hypothetical protein